MFLFRRKNTHNVHKSFSCMSKSIFRLSSSTFCSRSSLLSRTISSTNMALTIEKPKIPPVSTINTKKNRMNPSFHTFPEVASSRSWVMSFQPSTVKIWKIEYNDTNGFPKYFGDRSEKMKLLKTANSTL